MNKLLLIITLSLFGSSFVAQTNYTVTAYGNYWSVDELNIEVGDSITFINPNHGIHNINGTIESFPFNPESFGMIRESSNWIYGHRFLISGSYSFRCDLHPSMMGGTIVVNDHLGLKDEAKNSLLFPNPVTSFVSITNAQNASEIDVVDLMGNKVYSEINPNRTIFDFTKLPPGAYLLSIKTEQQTSLQRFVKL